MWVMQINLPLCKRVIHLTHLGMVTSQGMTMWMCQVMRMAMLQRKWRRTLFIKSEAVRKCNHTEGAFNKGAGQMASTAKHTIPLPLGEVRGENRTILHFLTICSLLKGNEWCAAIHRYSINTLRPVKKLQPYWTTDKVSVRTKIREKRIHCLGVVWVAAIKIEVWCQPN